MRGFLAGAGRRVEEAGSRLVAHVAGKGSLRGVNRVVLLFLPGRRDKSRLCVEIRRVGRLFRLLFIVWSKAAEERIHEGRPRVREAGLLVLEEVVVGEFVDHAVELLVEAFQGHDAPPVGWVLDRVEEGRRLVGLVGRHRRWLLQLWSLDVMRSSVLGLLLVQAELVELGTQVKKEVLWNDASGLHTMKRRIHEGLHVDHVQDGLLGQLGGMVR